MVDSTAGSNRGRRQAPRRGAGQDGPQQRARMACSAPLAARLESKSLNNQVTGEVSEWLKEHAWKVCIR